MPRRPAAADPLGAYRKKRDFSRTAEPDGAASGARTAQKPAPEAGGGAFVVQRHWATREHFDFRLEIGGVLKSWAVARGPSPDPADKRLAVRTEDHPLAYGGFEGMIPKGQYGGGTVMLWDRGTFVPLADDADAALAQGKLAFLLDGQRMKGRWALVRMKPRSPADAKRENWLLIKEKDEFVAPLGGFIDDAVTSVASRKTREEIERGAHEVWTSGGAAPAPKRARKTPEFTPPMLATLRETPPEGPDWRYEIKYDGYRLQACVSGPTVRLFSREGLDWTRRFPDVARAFAALDLPACAIDGEAVVFDARGVSDFSKLVAALDAKGAPIGFVAFDLLSQGRKDFTKQPLDARRAALETLLAKADGETIRLAPVLEGEGKAVFEAAIEGGAEGVVAKRRSSAYVSRRTGDWAKIKGDRRIDVVVVGFLPSKRRALSSLAVAIEEGKDLRFAGGVGSGFSQAELARTKAALDDLARNEPPPLLDREKAARTVRWAEPKLKAEIAFAGFTGDGQLRHARFLGWKEDRKAAAPAPRAAAAAKRARLTHPEKVLYADAGLTKQDLADYYAAVADRIMPHLEGRPVSLVRAPEGIDGERFFQRHTIAGMKAGIGRIPDPGRGHGDYLQVLSAEGLATCAQFSVVELHGWGARLPALDRPDRVVFDLDPDETVAFADVRRAAREIADLLEAAGLRSWPLVSGGKGVHVVAPLGAKDDWDAVAGFAEGVAKGLAQADSERFVAVASKDRRKGRIFIDWLRNKQGASAIAPWSPRARARGSAAVPVTWAQLARLRSADAFTLAAAAKRDDPWTDFFDAKQRISAKALAHLRKTMGAKG